MDWQAVGIWVGIGLQVLLFAFLYGRMTERLKHHDNRILRLEGFHDTQLKHSWERN